MPQYPLSLCLNLLYSKLCLEDLEVISEAKNRKCFQQWIQKLHLGKLSFLSFNFLLGQGKCYQLFYCTYWLLLKSIWQFEIVKKQNKSLAFQSGKVGKPSMHRAYFVFLGSAVLFSNACGLGYIYKRLNMTNAINIIPIIECVMNIVACITVATFCSCYTLNNADRFSVSTALTVINAIIYTGGKQILFTFVQIVDNLLGVSELMSLILYF